jgi:integrase
VLLRAQVGDNPAKDRVIARNAPRYEVFLQEYWSKMLLRWKPSTRERNIIYRKRHLDRAFAGRFINQISEADVLRWFSHITNNSGPAAANRVLEIIRAMFNRAEAWGVLPEGSNPCNEIKRNKLRKHECWLSDEELERFGSVLERLKEDDPMSVAAIQLIMLTGCRKSEIVNLCWSEVKGRRLLLHDAKTGPRTVWLGHPAEQLLVSLPRHVALEQVFWRGDKPLSVNMLEHQYRQARAEAGLKHVRLHDLRHSFASHAAMQSETLPMIGKLLGHSRIQSTARYAHLDDRMVLEAVEQIGEIISTSLTRT